MTEYYTNLMLIFNEHFILSRRSLLYVADRSKAHENENENVPSCVWWAHPTLLVLLRARAPLTFFLTLT